MLERFGHFNIKTPLFDETVTFYQKLFDLQRGPALTMADQARNAWLSTSDGRAIIHVNKTNEDETVCASPPRLDHIAFECLDLDEFQRRLTCMGVDYKYSASPFCLLDQVFFLDPNGIKIELTFERAFK